jgi:hypothetical protein
MNARRYVLPPIAGHEEKYATSGNVEDEGFRIDLDVSALLYRSVSVDRELLTAASLKSSVEPCNMIARRDE